MDDAIRKAGVLIEALEYIRTFRGRQTVIKLGGSAMEEADALRATLQSVAFLSTVGLRPVLVHGGGKPIDRAMAASGLQPKKVQGRRVTDEATLAIVVRVLTEEVNAGIVQQLRELGGRAVGLHSSMQVLFGEKLLLESNGEKIDLGAVGHVTRVDVDLINDLTGAGIIPVIPSLAFDADGGWLNVNADTAAAGVAERMKASKLMMMTDTPGILRDRKDPNSLIPSLTSEGCRQLIREGIIDSGMIPKVEACVRALDTVPRAHILDGRVAHALLGELFTDAGVGTMITRDTVA
jgi:acetylglutamate kinase